MELTLCILHITSHMLASVHWGHQFETGKFFVNLFWSALSSWLVRDSLDSCGRGLKKANLFCSPLLSEGSIIAKSWWPHGGPNEINDLVMGIPTINQVCWTHVTLLQVPVTTEMCTDECRVWIGRCFWCHVPPTAIIIIVSFLTLLVGGSKKKITEGGVALRSSHSWNLGGLDDRPPFSYCCRVRPVGIIPTDDFMHELFWWDLCTT